MRLRASDLLASTVFALLLTGLTSLRYALDPATGWPYMLTMAVVFDGILLYLFQNQARNYRRWSKHPTVFPNPMGGGIVGQYTLRPWQNELALMGQPKIERWNSELKKLDRISKRKAQRIRHLQRARTA